MAFSDHNWSPKGRRWEQWEEDLVLLHETTDKDLAQTLNRTEKAVSHRRSVLIRAEKNKRIAELRGHVV